MTNSSDIPGVPKPEGISPYGPPPPAPSAQGQITPYGAPDGYGGQSPVGGQPQYGGQDPYAGQSPYGNRAQYPDQGQYGGQAPYGAAPYGSGNPYLQPAPSSTTSGLAITALCLSAGGFLLQWLLPFLGLAMIGGIICGHIALSQISRTGQQGRGLALGGLITGYVGLGIGLIAVFIALFLIWIPLWGMAAYS